MIDAYLSAKPWGKLSEWKREQCAGCRVVHSFYCPFCCCLVGAPSAARESNDPLLPLLVDVVLRDDPSKSTGIHAKVLCPSSVNVRAFPDEVKC